MDHAVGLPVSLGHLALSMDVLSVDRTVTAVTPMRLVDLALDLSVPLGQLGGPLVVRMLLLPMLGLLLWWALWRVLLLLLQLVRLPALLELLTYILGLLVAKKVEQERRPVGFGNVKGGQFRENAEVWSLVHEQVA
jgi:hypothetical protein